MAAADADRNLLFGVLALQMDFLTRDALIAALNAWVLEKSKPLGRILVERGALAEDEDALLEALVRKHLERHRGDPEASLSALSPMPGAPEQVLEQVADPELQASLSHLATIKRIGDRDGTRTDPEAGSRTSRGTTRFQILRPYAEGGLGRVYIALDRELSREVALKQIKDERSEVAESRARFVFEAEVTGGLEHPGIVPVYSLGHDDHDRPYYAMRFVKGDNLKDAIERYHTSAAAGGDPSVRALALRGLLGRFIDVCNAVAYAHNRGVLHRDVKPGNILLGKYGETLVVDWGLAKAVDRPDTPVSADERTLRPSSGSSDQGTLPGSALGTPEYMSPEQAAGRLDRLGFASDVYSLGATLYCLLTGQPPFDSRVLGSAMPARIEAGDFPPPRQLKAEVPRALEAVCLKAMARRPEDRYATALELAAELERWLADEPVWAYREPYPTRAGRWFRRHKPLVAATAVLLVSALGGLLVNNQMVRKERDLARRARDAALSAEARAEAARTQAEQARQKEAAAHAESEASSRLARQAVDQMLVKVADEQLPHVPQMGQLRKDVAREALGFSREFLKQRPEDHDVRREAAMIFRRVANIERLTRDFPAALEHYHDAEVLIEKLVADFPQVTDDPDLLAELERDFAEALKAAARPKDALVHFGKAHEIARNQYAEKPDDLSFQRTLALVQNDFGLILFEVGRTREGLDRCNQAVELFTRLSRRQPLHYQYDPLLYLMSLVDRAPLQRAAGQLGDAEKSLAEAVTLARALLGQNSQDNNARYYLAAARCEQGTLLAEEHRKPAEAEKAFEESVRGLAALRADFPQVGVYRPKHAEAQSGRGGARAELGRLDDAEADCRQAQQTLEAILAESPQDAKATSLLAATLARRARIAQVRGDRSAAAQDWDQAIARQEALVKALPDNPRALRFLQQLRDQRKPAAGPP
jgi:serine/threonine-protein kinase